VRFDELHGLDLLGPGAGEHRGRGLRGGGAGRVVVAAPVAADTARADLADVSDDFVAVLQPAFFQSVGQWYSDFTQVTDDEVTALLAAAPAGRAEE